MCGVRDPRVCAARNCITHTHQHTNCTHVVEYYIHTTNVRKRTSAHARALINPLCAAAAFLATGPFSPRAPSRSRRARVWRGSEENGAREATARGARGIRAGKRPSERFARAKSQSSVGEELLLFFVLSSDLVFSPLFFSLSKRPLQAVSRSPTGTARERSRSARSASTRSRPSS